MTTTIGDSTQLETNPLPSVVSKNLAAILLICVAMHQFVKAQTDGLTSWKGGGFGMFASLDQERFAKLYVTKDGEFFAVAIPDEEQFAEAYRRSLALPLKSTASDLATLIDQQRNLPEGEQAIAAVFFVDFNQKTRNVIARNVHMVSSKPQLSGNRLVWKW